MGLHGSGVWGLSPANQKGAIRKKCKRCGKWYYPESWSAWRHDSCKPEIPTTTEEFRKGLESQLDEAKKFWEKREV